MAASPPDPAPGAAPASRTIAVVPVRSLEGAKSRLGEVLDAEERRDLVVELLGRTIDALRGAEGIDAVIVVSRDEAALDIARASGVIALRQTRGGLNAALEEARATALDRRSDDNPRRPRATSRRSPQMPWAICFARSCLWPAPQEQLKREASSASSASSRTVTAGGRTCSCSPRRT